MQMENSIHAWKGGKINNKKISVHTDWLALGPDLLVLFTAILSTHRHKDKWLHVIFLLYEMLHKPCFLLENK